MIEKDLKIDTIRDKKNNFMDEHSDHSRLSSTSSSSSKNSSSDEDEAPSLDKIKNVANKVKCEIDDNDITQLTQEVKKIELRAMGPPGRCNNAQEKIIFDNANLKNIGVKSNDKKYIKYIKNHNSISSSPATSNYSEFSPFSSDVNYSNNDSPNNYKQENSFIRDFSFTNLTSPTVFDIQNSQSPFPNDNLFYSHIDEIYDNLLAHQNETVLFNGDLNGLDELLNGNNNDNKDNSQLNEGPNYLCLNINNNSSTNGIICNNDKDYLTAIEAKSVNQTNISSIYNNSSDIKPVNDQYQHNQATLKPLIIQNQTTPIVSNLPLTRKIENDWPQKVKITAKQIDESKRTIRVELTTYTSYFILNRRHKNRNTILHELTKCYMMEYILSQYACDILFNSKPNTIVWLPTLTFLDNLIQRLKNEQTKEIRDKTRLIKVLNEKNDFNQTALYLAIYYNRSDLIQLLYSPSTENILQNDNKSNLHLACQRGFYACYLILWEIHYSKNEYREFINRSDLTGNTPLSLALQYHSSKVDSEDVKHLDIIRHLICTAKALVYLQDHQNNTCAHIICQNVYCNAKEKIEILKLLNVSNRELFIVKNSEDKNAWDSWCGYERPNTKDELMILLSGHN